MTVQGTLVYFKMSDSKKYRGQLSYMHPHSAILGIAVFTQLIQGSEAAHTAVHTTLHTAELDMA